MAMPFRLILLLGGLGGPSLWVRPDSSAAYILNQHLQLLTSTSLRWVCDQMLLL